MRCEAVTYGLEMNACSCCEGVSMFCFLLRSLQMLSDQAGVAKCLLGCTSEELFADGMRGIHIEVISRRIARPVPEALPNPWYPVQGCRLHLEMCKIVETYMFLLTNLISRQCGEKVTTCHAPGSLKVA